MYIQQNRIVLGGALDSLDSEPKPADIHTLSCDNWCRFQLQHHNPIIFAGSFPISFPWTPIYTRLRRELLYTQILMKTTWTWYVACYCRQPADCVRRLTTQRKHCRGVAVILRLIMALFSMYTLSILYQCKLVNLLIPGFFFKISGQVEKLQLKTILLQ